MVCCDISKITISEILMSYFFTVTMYKFSKSHEKQLLPFFYESQILIKLDYSQRVSTLNELGTCWLVVHFWNPYYEYKA